MDSIWFKSQNLLMKCFSYLLIVKCPKSLLHCTFHKTKPMFHYQLSDDSHHYWTKKKLKSYMTHQYQSTEQTVSVYIMSGVPKMWFQMTIHYFGLTNVPKQKQKPEINEACHLILCAKVAIFFHPKWGYREEKVAGSRGRVLL